jgi:HD-GYP domain-containing protein (c-di-GMP phosphodiesterase class II)
VQETTGSSISRAFIDESFNVLGRELLSAGERDPRYQRWFHKATDSGTVTRTDMSILSSGQAGTTVSKRSGIGPSVVALDIAIDTLSARLKEHRITPGSQIALLDRDGRVIAHPDKDRFAGRTDRRGRPRLPAVFETGEDALADLYRDAHGKDVRMSLETGTRQWIGFSRNLESDIGDPVTLLLAVPRDELLTDVRASARRQVLIGLAIAALAPLIAWLLSRRISRPLEILAKEAHSIRSLDFSPRQPIRSRIVEVHDLAQAMNGMRSTIRQFLDTSTTLAAESRLDRLLERVIDGTITATGADYGELHLIADEEHTTVRAASRRAGHTDAQAAVEAPEPHMPALVERAVSTRATVIDDSQAGRIVLATPLANRDRDLIGVLLLTVPPSRQRGAADDLAPLVAFVEALSGVAAVAIEARHHIEAQRALLNALIELLGCAIDAKSPYTGGHCQRVPAIARMLAEAACNASEGPLGSFDLDELGWEALHLASWLHDCGKVTTPEYVVDKATKLETLYNRIHEVRARFEILKRDAEIEYWKARVDGNDTATAHARMLARWSELDEEFAFIAASNVGGESMADSDLERIRRIASRTFVRTLDDRLGLSEEDRRRLADVPNAALPAIEPLLADRPEHIVAWGAHEHIAADNPWGLKLSPPRHRLNLGEVHSLCVRKGTLTPEERYLINDHIVQTIIMLSKLPFPRKLRSVPEWACGHHEKMDGTGYPRQLRGADMSVPARILAIADVFEALTASDRPYKSGKTLDESLRIMRAMAHDGHIDPDLFDLFVREKVYLRYAEQFLEPAQWFSVEKA